VFVYFFADFERAALGLVILRTSLDIFSEQQIPAVFALGVDALTLLYVALLLLTRRTVHTDSFWWFFAGWVMVQGLWVIVSALGGLGLAPSEEVLQVSQREWIRLFSWLMVYLMVMQLKYQLHPEKIISMLFISLFIPVIAALMQMFLPDSLLPPLLATEHVIVEGRIEGTFGHPNGFATYLLLFMSLIYWKLSRVRRHWPWVLLLSMLAFVFVATKALFSLAMLSVFIVVSIARKLKPSNAIGGVLLLVVILGLFASSDFGRARLGILADTPLFNPRIDVSRAVLMSQWDYNSFNWRLAQWTYLLQSWEKSPILGYGLGTTIYLSQFKLYAHNDYIRALVEQGSVGLVTFLTFLGAQFVRLVQLIRCAPRGSGQQELCSLLLAYLVAILVGMITENVWSHTTLFFYWWTLFAIASWNWNELPPSKSPVLLSPLFQTPP
jgi:O-antigen ligase